MDVGVPSPNHTVYVARTNWCGHANGTPASCLRTIRQAHALRPYYEPGALFVYNSLSDFPNFLHESSSPARSKVRRQGCRSAVVSPHRLCIYNERLWARGRHSGILPSYLTTSRGLCSYTIPYRIFQTFYTRAAVRLVVRYGDRDVGVPSSHHTAYAYITKGCGHANGTPASCLRTLLRAGALFVYNSLSDFPNFLHESNSPVRSKVRRQGCRSAVVYPHRICG